MHLSFLSPLKDQAPTGLIVYPSYGRRQKYDLVRGFTENTMTTFDTVSLLLHTSDRYSAIASVFARSISP
jgi:hypothetical protein